MLDFWNNSTFVKPHDYKYCPKCGADFDSNIIDGFTRLHSYTGVIFESDFQPKFLVVNTDVSHYLSTSKPPSPFHRICTHHQSFYLSYELLFCPFSVPSLSLTFNDS